MKKPKHTRPPKSDSEVPKSNMFQSLDTETGDGSSPESDWPNPLFNQNDQYFKVAHARLAGYVTRHYYRCLICTTLGALVENKMTDKLSNVY